MQKYFCAKSAFYVAPAYNISICKLLKLVILYFITILLKALDNKNFRIIKYRNLHINVCPLSNYVNQ